MEIHFSSRRLERIFNTEQQLVRTYGDRMAGVIKVRMAVLRGASNLSLVPVEKPIRRHQLSQDRQGQFAVDSIQPYRLVFRPAHDPIPTDAGGGIDIKAITAIEIIKVVDYH